MVPLNRCGVRLTRVTLYRDLIPSESQALQPNQGTKSNILDLVCTDDINIQQQGQRYGRFRDEEWNEGAARGRPVPAHDAARAIRPTDR